MKKKVIVSIVSLIIVLLLLACGSVVYVNASTSEDFDKLQLISQEVTGTDVDLGFLHTQEKIDAEMKTLNEQKDSLDKSLTATSDSLNIKLDDILKVNDKSKEDLMSGLTLEEQVQYLNALASVDDMVYIKGMDNYEADKSSDKIKSALKSIQASVDSSYDAVIKELSGDTNSKKDTGSEVSEITSEQTSDKKVTLTKKDINEFLKIVDFDKKLAGEVINLVTSIQVSEDLVKTLDDARTNIVKQVKLIDTEVKSIKKKEKEEAEAKKKAEAEAKAKAEAEALAAEQAEASNYSNGNYYSSNDSGYSSSSSSASNNSSSSNSGSSSSNSGGSSSNSNSGGGATISPPTYAAGTVGALGVSGCEGVINSSYAANGWNIKSGSGSSDYIGITGDGNTSCSIANIANGDGKSGYADVVDNGNGTYTFHFYLTGF